MMLDFLQISKAAEFLNLAHPLLVKEEATNGLLLGRTLHLSKTPHEDLMSSYFLVQKDGVPVLAGIQTPPYNLILSTAEEEQASLYLFDCTLQKKRRFPGVIGPRPICLPFAQNYTQAYGLDFKIDMQQLVYQLDEVLPATRQEEGSLRLAEEEDLPMLTQWMKAFVEEAMRQVESEEKAKMAAERKIDRSEIYLWEVNGQVVSMAGIARPTYNGIAVNYVFTPKVFRKRGYAEACVRALSTLMLQNGFQFCTLFTDELYPTSNAVYKRIGYRQVASFYNINFVEG